MGLDTTKICPCHHEIDNHDESGCQNVTQTMYYKAKCGCKRTKQEAQESSNHINKLRPGWHE